LDQLHLGCLGGQSERDVDARHRCEDIGDDAMAFWKSRHFIEHQRWVAHLSLINVNEAADLLFGFGSLDDLQLPGIFDAADPVS
jgi:hypothetical protein